MKPSDFPGLSYGLPTPPAGGLWRREHEQDSCGIGFVADLKGARSHRIVQKGLEAVSCLTHRGAVAADSKTGDGAGILTQIPHKLLRASLGKGQARLLKRDEDLAVAVLFCPKDSDDRHRVYYILEGVIEEFDLIFLARRFVPLNREALGKIAQETVPEVRQLLLMRPDGMTDQMFERTCYLMRRRMEQVIEEAGIADFYIPSFSSKTIVYKGLCVAPQLPKFYLDLQNPEFESALCLYHQRYSTNTFPTWFLAQPFRFVAHNGEINTVQGNINWIRAREMGENSTIWGSNQAMQELRPLIQGGGSDSAALDNAFESIVASGRDLLHTALMMVPDAYQTVPDMDDDLRAFYEYHAALQEPWDGPAALSFTDGDVIGACLDRNGLRPFRYQISSDGLLLVGSEVGTVDLEGARVLEKGRLGPGQILALDLRTGELMRDDEVKERYSQALPYRDWVSESLVDGASITGGTDQIVFDAIPPAFGEDLLAQQKAFGFTTEDVDDVISPMVKSGVEPTLSMGDDTPLAVLSEKPRLLYTYFRQRFAQVTNPPIDPLREKLVMSLNTFLGPLANLWQDNTSEGCRRIEFPTPLLLNEQLAALRQGEANWGPVFKAATVASIFPVTDGESGLEMAITRLQTDAAAAVRAGAAILIISDRGVNAAMAPIPALLATGAVHHHLIRQGLRTRCSLVVESGEPRDSHHFACLIGYGAAAVNPYLALETAHNQTDPEIVAKSVANFKKATENGLLKIMSKMGISAVASYHGAQVFEILGLGPDLVETCFTHTPSRIRGCSYTELCRDVLRLHATAYPEAAPATDKLENFAYLRFRNGGEQHAFTPSWFKPFHSAVRTNDYETQYKIYSDAVTKREKPIVLRDLLAYKPLGTPIPLEDVESVESLFKRFCTGAMSHGSLSSEAHETIAIAMNRIGGKSNSGEGGEDPARFHRDANGDWRNSAIKQIASARFGVTPEYLVSAKELQIKMAQGAKPGEGGQLPGFKVSAEIAFIRHSVPGVTLISPPPHHDIYSIEDLAQLIYDLKMVNPRARVSVKLVAQAGVGTVASGVVKAYADTIIIAGHDGGTGASPLGSIKNTGISWELGLAETQQVLIQNNLRGRVRLHADGGFKTGRDVLIAALLGAEEYGFGTAALMAVGCVMARQCHLNTCPVGVATQDVALRAKFPGTPEHVVNFFHFVAQDIRERLAAMGARKLDDIIGRSDLLQVREDAYYPKTSDLDLTPLFHFEEKQDSVVKSNVGRNDRPEDWPLDDTILQEARDAISDGSHLTLSYPIKNTDRTVGARIAGEIAYNNGDKGLQQGSITLNFTGTAGQSFGAFNIHGLNLYLEGEGLDYVGKSMHGGKIVVKPGSDSDFIWADNVIIGNTVMYGSTGGFLFAAGKAGERFCVRNSGGLAVVEGVGDHGCEYMTGGTVVVLGEAGRNFGAGMSGGLAYIWDAAQTFEKRYNTDMIGIERVTNVEDAANLKQLVKQHFEETGSPHAQAILKDWETNLALFYKAVPHPEKAAAPTTERRARPARPTPAGTPAGTPPGTAAATAQDFSGKEPVALATTDVKEVPAPTP